MLESVTAAARKLLPIADATVRTGRPWDPDHWHKTTPKAQPVT